MNNQKTLYFKPTFPINLKNEAENILNKNLKLGRKFQSSESFSYLLSSDSEKYVGKIFRFEDSPFKGKLEHIQDLLKENNIYYEEVIYRTYKHPEFGFGWQLSKYISGDTVRNLRDGSSWDKENYYVQLGTLLKEVHKIKCNYFGSLINKDLQYKSFEHYIKQEFAEKDFSTISSEYEEMKKIILDAKKEVLENLDCFALDQPTLVHDDANDTNVIWQDGKPILIDWADSLASLPLREFATHTFRHDKSMLSFIEKGYGKTICQKELRLHQMIRFINLGYFFYFEDDDLEEFEKMMSRLSRLLKVDRPFGV